jgi:hypothetical protein
MNPTIIQELARLRIEELGREAAANQLAALAKSIARLPATEPQPRVTEPRPAPGPRRSWLRPCPDTADAG